MDDGKREKVIKGLECCKQGVNFADAVCGECPYRDGTDECIAILMADALEYIKESDDIRAFYVEKMDMLLAELKDRPDVVRCCECKYAHLTYAGEVKYCDRISMPDDEGDYGYALYLPGDFYCACGERMEENG